MKTILILGVDGMLGHRVWREFKRLNADFKTFGTIRGNTLPDVDEKVFGSSNEKWSNIYAPIDAIRPDSVLHVIKSLEPDFVINCIGIIKQREEQAHDPVQMIAVNTLLPHLIQNTLNKIGGKLITFSSDCVFLGNHAPYDEKCIPDAWSLYGRTKALGEVSAPALTLRTSFIGFEIKGFTSLLEWFLKSVREQELSRTPIFVRSIHGYQKAIWSGVSTAYLSKWIADQVSGTMPELSGVYNLGAEKINKFDLLQLIDRRFKLDASIIPSDKFEVDKICNRELDSSRLWSKIKRKIPNWNELIDGLFEDYKFYKG